MVNENIFIEIFDDDGGGDKDDLIGILNIKVSCLVLNAHRPEGNYDWHSIFLNNQRVGLLHVHSKFEGNIQYQKHEKTTE